MPKGYIAIPQPPKPITLDGMDSTSQASPQGRGYIPVPPPPTPITLPDQNKQTESSGFVEPGSPESRVPTNSGQNIKDLGTGILKGAGSTAINAARLGENVANQTAGRVVNAVQGKGFVPQSSSQLGESSLANSDSQTNKNVDEDLKASNSTQKLGKVLEAAGELAVPADAIGGLIGNAVKLSKEAKIPETAFKLASPKKTLGVVQKGLLSAGKNPRVVKDAKAIESLVRNGVVKLGNTSKIIEGNTSNLLGEIGKSAKDVISRIRSMDVKPNIPPEELNTFLKKIRALFKTEPDLTGDAGEYGKRLVDEFTNNILPKKLDVDSADMLEARQRLDAYLKARGTNLDPSRENAKTILVKTLRQGLNEIADKYAPDQGVKDSLSYQTSLYNVLENIAEKGAPIVKKAQELEELSGIKGVIARHPKMTGLLGGVISSGATTLGAGGIARLLGYHLTEQ